MTEYSASKHPFTPAPLTNEAIFNPVYGFVPFDRAKMSVWFFPVSSVE